MFTDNIHHIISNIVATIGGKYIIQKRIDTVSWSWTDDEGKLHKKKLNNILYFPGPTVNVLIATALDESMKEYEGTWVLTKRKIIHLLGILGSKEDNILLR